jgi:hypothetical protein
MTVEQTPEVPDNLMVINPGPAEVPLESPGERTPFALPQPDGDEMTVLYAIRPKSMTLAAIGERTSAALASEDPVVILNAHRYFIHVALDPASADVIWNRLNDADDFLDTPHIAAMVETLMTKWVGGARPTVKGSGSSRLQRGTGRPSTGQRRSKG